MGPFLLPTHLIIIIILLHVSKIVTLRIYLAVCYLDTLSPWEQLHMGGLLVLKLIIHDLNDD